MKKIGTMLLFSFLIAGCSQAQPDSEVPKKEAISTSSNQVNAPSFFHLSVLKDVNWEEAPSFVVLFRFWKANWKTLYYCTKTRVSNANTSPLSTRKFQTNLDCFKCNRFYYKRNPSHYIATFIWIMVIKSIYEWKILWSICNYCWVKWQN